MEALKCKVCEKVKSVDEFYLRKDTGKRTRECKACRCLRSQKHYAENTAVHAASIAVRYRTVHRFMRYGITKEEYDAQFEAQGRRCLLCEATEPGGKGEWSIDHEHEEGKDIRKGGFRLCSKDRVRAILCSRCNISLGHYESLASRVGHERLLSYLEGRLDGQPRWRRLLPRIESPLQPDQCARGEGKIS